MLPPLLPLISLFVFHWMLKPEPKTRTKLIYNINKHKSYLQRKKLDLKERNEHEQEFLHTIFILISITPSFQPCITNLLPPSHQIMKLILYLSLNRRQHYSRPRPHDTCCITKGQHCDTTERTKLKLPGRRGGVETRERGNDYWLRVWNIEVREKAGERRERTRVKSGEGRKRMGERLECVKSG